MNGFLPSKSQLPLILLSGVFLFWYWAFELLFSIAPLKTTPMYIWSEVAQFIGLAEQINRAPIISLLLFLFGAMTLHGMLLRDIRKGHWWMLPQGVLLLVQGMFCLYFASAGHYADDTPCPPAHIRNDQMPFIIAFSVMHSISVIDLSGGSFITRAFYNLCLKIQVKRGK